MSQGYCPAVGWGFERRARKPAGGFCFIASTSLLAAWEAYRNHDIQLLDLRVWFGCFELVARRCGLQKGRWVDYRLDELRPLVGGRDSGRLAGAVQRLETAGLLRWSSTELDLTTATAWAQAQERPRPVPVPRRLLRNLAAGTSRAVLATVLGHLLKCLWYRGGQCISGGRCKASWIAQRFGVDLRNVKAARKRLLESGWLEAVSSAQRALNRWGMAIIWRLGFHVEHSEASPPRVAGPAGSPPPIHREKLPSGSQHQTGRGGQRRKKHHEHPTPPNPASAPTLYDVRRTDLADDRRLVRLHEQATARGWVSTSECDRLRVFAAAEHARACGRTNPAGLFVWLLKNRRWDYLSQRDEDAARMRLHQGRDRERRPCATAAPSTIPSSVGSLCAMVVSALANRRSDGRQLGTCKPR